VAFVAAELAGPAGEVVGIDQSPDSVAKATARAAGRGLSNVRFVVGDIHDRAPDGPFDAITARLVLMYVPDPAAVLRRLACCGLAAWLHPSSSTFSAPARCLRRH
jgi:ubiquinone/menaquinone biosynthesis C-methylase UbiE